MCKLKRCMEITLRILRPHVAWVFLLTLFSAAALIFTFITNREASVIGYAAYVISAYTTAVLVLNMPEISARTRSLIYSGGISVRIKTLLRRSEFGNRYIDDMTYRAKVSLYFSLVMNLFYAAFKLAAGIHYASFWYGADAVFYIVLSAVRVLLLRHVRNKGEDKVREFRQYRFCGYMLFVLNVAMIGVVYQIVHQDMGYQYPGLLIYVVATFAFFCLSVAIINVFRYRKLNSPVLSSIKAISLAKTLMAMFALQTAMLASFGGEETESFKRLVNSLTGGGVCITIFGVAVYMVVRGQREVQLAATNR